MNQYLHVWPMKYVGHVLSIKHTRISFHYWSLFYIITPQIVHVEETCAIILLSNPTFFTWWIIKLLKNPM